jgi:hypothetical protein
MFVDEAIEANYEVGVILWNTTVVSSSEISRNPGDAGNVLSSAHAGGGNDLLEPLSKCHKLLNAFAGDRVVAIFGDGDLTPKARVLEKVESMKRENIRFVTRGLGPVAAREFGEVSSEEPSQSAVLSVDKLADGIAGMAASLKPRAS